MLVYEWSLIGESMAFGLWALTLGVAVPLTQLVSLRHAVSAFERRLARTPRWVRRVVGPPTVSPGIRTASWRAFERTHGASTFAVDAAMDVLFAVPMLCAWLLLGGIAEIVIVSAAVGSEDAPDVAVTGAVLGFMNFTAFVTTLVARNRCWLSRAPFEWQLVRLVAVHHANLQRILRARRGAGAEDQLALSTRNIERALWARFPPQHADQPSDAAAAAAWAQHIAPALSARVNRVLDSTSAPASAWFDGWVERIAETIISPPRTTFTDASTLERPRSRRNGDAVTVAVLWAITVVAAALAVLFLGGTARQVETALTPIGSVAVAVIPFVTLLNLVLGLVRANRGASR
jgi:hypothetical protein